MMSEQLLSFAAAQEHSLHQKKKPIFVITCHLELPLARPLVGWVLRCVYKYARTASVQCMVRYLPPAVCIMLVFFPVIVFLASCSCALTQTGLSSSDKQELLDAHNYFRAGVSPIATDMKMMVKWIRIQNYLVP